VFDMTTTPPFEPQTDCAGMRLLRLARGDIKERA